jgi:Domain of unknown function (DUF4430)
MFRYSALLTIISILLIVGCSPDDANEANVKSITYPGEHGKTVFEILDTNHDVDYTESDMGVFINSIDGIKNADGKYWRYYINDNPGKVAADKVNLTAEDIVEWKYR